MKERTIAAQAAPRRVGATAMSECISREERAFLHALAQESAENSLGKRIGSAARALVAALEQGREHERHWWCKHGILAGCGRPECRERPAPVEPKRERTEELLGVEGALKALIQLHHKGTLDHVTLTQALDSYRAEKAEWETRLADFKAEWSKAYDQLAAERAAHEELRRRVERAIDCPYAYDAVRRILKGEET